MSVAVPFGCRSNQTLNFPENGGEGQIRRCQESEEIVMDNVNEGSRLENGC